MSEHVRVRRPAGAAGDRLARALDAPEQLARVVQHLAPETLHRIIQRRGLDGCEALVVAATPAQLEAVLDLDLWRSVEPGSEEIFDAARFGEWLELLAEAGEAVAAATLAAIDRDLVVTGLSHHVRVLDLATLTTVASDDEGADSRAFEGAECEMGGYVVRARQAGNWDAIVTVLQALEQCQPDFFHSVMRGCRDLSDSTPESDGLDALLLAPDQQIHDARLDREGRRTARGYAAAGDARAFLEIARRPLDARERQGRANPIAIAYFRELDAAMEVQQPARPHATSLLHPRTPSDAEASATFAELLAEEGLVPEAPRLLIGGTTAEPRLTCIRWAMAELLARDQAAYLTRGRELAYLANTLATGCSVQSRAFTPQEASDAAVSVCNLGLEHWPDRWPGDSARPHKLEKAPTGTIPHGFLLDHDLVTAFEVGWAVLYEDVCLFTARHLIEVLANVRFGDDGISRDVYALRRELSRQVQAGAPWKVRAALDLLAVMDSVAWAGLVALLDECPTLPSALPACLDGRALRINPAEFDFISTRDQLRTVRDFMTRLPMWLRP